MSRAKPDDLSPERELAPDALEAGRLLFARECRFVAGAAGASALPPETLPEVAFIGRSNVGKSSLINALTGRRTLARISQTPGRTRQLNFFALGGRLMLVDLPGYGYAAASKGEIAAWTSLMQRYLRGRAGLARVCLLLDARHGIMAADAPLMNLCDAAGLSYQAVLTKADKPRTSALAALREGVAAELARHGAAHPEIVLTSAETGAGIAALRAILAGFAAPDQIAPASLATIPG
ncbi:MAG: ribosome biogenesis GTP-binding protein YihA/YsxC [Stellaceae bacterium]